MAFGFGPGSGLAMQMGMTSMKQASPILEADTLPMVTMVLKVSSSLALQANNFPHPPFLVKGNENWISIIVVGMGEEDGMLCTRGRVSL